MMWAASAAAILLCAATTVQAATVTAEQPIPIFTKNVGGGAPPLDVTFDPSLSYIPTAPSGSLYIYTAVWDFGDGSDLFYVGPTTDRTLLLQPVIHNYTEEALYTITLKIIIKVVQVDPTTGKPLVQAFVRFSDSRDGFSNICVPYPGGYHVDGNEVVLEKPVPRPPTVTAVGPVTGNSETFTYNPSDTYKYSYIFSRLNPDPAGTPTEMDDALYRGTFNPTGEDFPPPTPVAAPPSPTPFYPLVSATATLPTDNYLLDPTTLAVLGLPFEPLPLICYGTGTEGETSSLSHIVVVNHEPDVRADLIPSSPAEGTAPFTVTIDPSDSWDEDGYFVWFVVDWGDGTCELMPTVPPYEPRQTLSHTYDVAGNYKITISGIDNGRIPVPAVLDAAILAGTVPALPTPSCTGPDAALQAFIDYQENYLRPAGLVTSPAAPLTDAQQQPRMHQDFIFIEVHGDADVVKARFSLKLSKTGRDFVELKIRPNEALQATNLLNAPVTVTVGPTSYAFTTDFKGRYRDRNIKFKYNAKKNVMQFLARRQTLTATWSALYGIPTQFNTAGGNADVPFAVVLNSSDTISGVVRFAYRVKAGRRVKSFSGRTLQ